MEGKKTPPGVEEVAEETPGSEVSGDPMDLIDPPMDSAYATAAKDLGLVDATSRPPTPIGTAAVESDQGDALPAHLRDLMVAPRGGGFEVFFVQDPDPAKLWHAGWSMVYLNGQPVGLVSNLKLEVSPDCSHFQLSLSQVIQMKNIHSVSAKDMDTISAGRREKKL